MTTQAKRSSKGSVGIETFQNRLRLRLPRQLFEGKQKYLSLGLADTLENRKLAESKARQIELDILAGYFDASLEKYKSQTSSTAATSMPKYSLLNLWDEYTAYKSKTLTITTINKDFKRTRNHIRSLPTQKVTDAIAIRNFLLDHLTLNTAKRVLTQLKACCDWAMEADLIDANPFAGLAQKIKLVRTDEEESINPFSKTEQEQIIAAFEKSRYYRHYVKYVKFLFMTGCRTSEAIGLQWKHIDKNFTKITFTEAVVERNRKDTKTHKTRRFPINGSLKELLQSIEAGDRDPNSPVFKAPRGGMIDAHNFLNRAWTTILTSLPMEYRCQYCTRHTFITNCLEAGVSVVQVAKWVGNSPEVIMKHYAGIIKNVDVPEF